WPTCNVFKKGHRIRVTMTGSDWPHLMPILIPSWNEIVIDDSHEARLDFTTTNTNNEGATWKWLTDPAYGNLAFDRYLLNHKDTIDESDSDGTDNDGDSDSDTDNGGGSVTPGDNDSVTPGDDDTISRVGSHSSADGCGSAAEASVMAGGSRPLLPGLMSTMVMMLIPLALMGVHRRIRRRS
ncbi:MAG TPA: CocE/NonD family hydrolase C-terminal non-catalytic domain-containing protein, partial [Spirochaetota bacterium]|nr:CocE/NonD family hydrolase C-terminal non-catalytic domain-containing protein [Spirochaetota bacterium]